jgi:hypothetical protein
VSLWGATVAGMKTVEMWHWRLRDHRGKVQTTRWAMTEADALERDPLAVRVPNSREARNLPETPEEMVRTLPGYRSQPKQGR